MIKLLLVGGALAAIATWVANLKHNRPKPEDYDWPDEIGHDIDEHEDD